MTISFQSLNTSQRALEVGQRAYVDGKVKFTREINETGGITYDIGIELHNTGNTPAAIENVSATCSDSWDENRVTGECPVTVPSLSPEPDDGQRLGGVELAEEAGPNAVSGRDSIAIKYGSFTIVDASQLSDQMPLMLPQLHAIASYRDVFGAHHQIKFTCQVTVGESDIKEISCWNE